MFLRCPTSPGRHFSGRSAVAATALVASVAALTGLTAMSASAATTARHLTSPTTPRMPAKIAPNWTTPAVGPAVPLPVFSKSFTSGGQSFTYRMVGTDPQGAAATTTVPCCIAKRIARRSAFQIARCPASLRQLNSHGSAK